MTHHNLQYQYPRKCHLIMTEKDKFFFEGISRRYMRVGIRAFSMCSTMMAQKSKFRVVFGYILRKRKCILDFNIDAFFVRGTLSYRVQRYRIQPEEEPSWQLIYVGQKTEYEAQGLVPEFILQKEMNTAVSCTFCVQVSMFLFRDSPSTKKMILFFYQTHLHAFCCFRRRSLLNTNGMNIAGFQRHLRNFHSGHVLLLSKLRILSKS